MPTQQEVRHQETELQTGALAIARYIICSFSDFTLWLFNPLANAVELPTTMVPLLYPSSSENFLNLDKYCITWNMLWCYHRITEFWGPQVWMQCSRWVSWELKRGENHLPWPASYLSSDAGQDTSGFLGYKHTFLDYVHLCSFVWAHLSSLSRALDGIPSLYSTHFISV